MVQNMDVQQPSDHDEALARAAQGSVLVEMVKKKFGEDTLDRLSTSSEQIATAIMYGLLQIENKPEATSKFITTIEEFSNALYARLNSENLDPSVATTALEGATALMSAEPLPDLAPRAATAAKALSERYSIADK